MGKCLFIRFSNALEDDMRIAKQRFPLLQILFVIINKKGDPVYGEDLLQNFSTCFIFTIKFYSIIRNREAGW